MWRGLSKCGRLGRRVLAPTLCDRYRASLHVVLALLVSHHCLVSRLGCHIVWQLSAADFKHPCLKLWASTITHPCVCGRWGRCICASTAICAVASVHRQPFVPLHLCIDSHLCRCIVQRLCVAVFMHPCITALCGCLYASLHNDFGRPLSCILCTFMNALLVSHPCLVSRLGCHIVWQLSAADFKHPCLKLWAFIL